MKNIHPETKKCTFTCSTCQTKFEIDTIMKSDSYGVDVCSQCHPFYIGKSTNKHVGGRSEKLAAKFDAGKTNVGKKATKAAKERKIKKESSFESL